MTMMTIKISEDEVNLVKAQLKTVAKRFARYARREPHEEISGEDRIMIDDTEKWSEYSMVFERMYRQL